MIKKYLQFIKENKDEMSSINPIIDYTLLEETATEDEIRVLCRKAIVLKVKSVCVLPNMVKTAAEALKDSSVLVCTVVSFPDGFGSVTEKETEIKRVIQDGADEIDMVLNYHLLTQTDNYSGSPRTYDLKNFLQDDHLTEEVTRLVNTCKLHSNKEGRFIVNKVIIESGALNEAQIRIATQICIKCGVDFVKTSTGKGPGANIDGIRTIYNTIKSAGSVIRIKASGGIKDLNQINQFMTYVDRFGIGFGTVDKLNNMTSDASKSNY